MPPSATRRSALALPAFPASIEYSAELRWPQSVSAVLEPSTQPGSLRSDHRVRSRIERLPTAQRFRSECVFLQPVRSSIEGLLDDESEHRV